MPVFYSNIALKRLDTEDSIVSTAVIGTVEELAASPSTLTLIRDQFETNFFGAVNIIKAALPAMRERKSGHIIVLTGISAFLLPPRQRPVLMTVSQPAT